MCPSYDADRYEKMHDVPDYVMLREKTPIARKEHECTYCHKPIPVGEKYHLHVYLLDGVFTLDKVHQDCFYGRSYDE